MALSVVFYIMSHQLNKMTRTSNGLTATSSYTKGLVVRGVCFHPSPSTLEHCNRAAQSKSPVKITNFDTGKKRKDDQVDIIIRKKTKLEETEETLPFQRTSVKWGASAQNKRTATELLLLSPLQNYRLRLTFY